MAKISQISCIEVEHNFDTYEIDYTLWDDNTITITKISPFPSKSMDAEKLLKQKLTPNTTTVNHINFN